MPLAVQLLCVASVALRSPRARALEFPRRDLLRPLFCDRRRPCFSRPPTVRRRPLVVSACAPREVLPPNAARALQSSRTTWRTQQEPGGEPASCCKKASGTIRAAERRRRAGHTRPRSPPSGSLLRPSAPRAQPAGAHPLVPRALTRGGPASCRSGRGPPARVIVPRALARGGPASCRSWRGPPARVIVPRALARGGPASC